MIVLRNTQQGVNMIFESLEDAQENTGRLIGVMALSGMGKSSLGTSLKGKTLWISTDHGLTGLYKHEGYDPKNFTVVKISSLEQYEEFYEKFIGGNLKDQNGKPILPSDFSNIIYDDMTQLTIWGETRADLNEEAQRAIENEGLPESKQKKRLLLNSAAELVRSLTSALKERSALFFFSRCQKLTTRMKRVLLLRVVMCQ